MKVKELIAVLQTVDSELDVSISSEPDEYGPRNISKVVLFDGADVELVADNYDVVIGPGVIWPLPTRDDV